MNQTCQIDLLIVADPVESRWELLPISDGRTWLLTWTINPWPIDAGVPEPLALAICEALCACGWVVHLSPWVRGLKPQWGWMRSIDGPKRWYHAVRMFLGFRVIRGWLGLSLTATSNPETAVEAFDTPSFDWTQHGQIIFLLPPGDLPPLDRSALRSLLRGTPPSIRSLTGTPALRGVVLPGVDGDVAQITTFDPGLWPELEPALIAAAKARGISVRHATEAEAIRPPPAASQSRS